MEKIKINLKKVVSRSPHIFVSLQKNVLLYIFYCTFAENFSDFSSEFNAPLL